MQSKARKTRAKSHKSRKHDITGDMRDLKIHELREKERVAHVQKELEELFKYDPRGRNSVGAEMIGSNVNPVVPDEISLDGNVLGGLLLGPISYASYRGWQAAVSNPSFPYFAYIYMVRALQNFSQGGDVITGTVPRWFALMVQAVVRKSVKLKAGKVNYQFTVTTEASEFWVLGMGPSAYGKGYTFGRKSDPVVFVNGDIPTLVPPTPYSDQLGQQAIQSFWNYISSLDESPMHDMVSVVADNRMTNDPSAFAVNTVWPGGGYFQTGGFFTRAELEVFIKSPMFSCLLRRQPGSVPSNRFPNQIMNRSGDTVSLGATMVSNLHPRQLHMKNVTSYKFIDMYEIVDVLYRWICSVQQNQVNSSFFDEKFKSDSNFFEDVVKYPLTLQQLALLVRATLLSSNQDHQIVGQALFPRGPTSNNDLEFVSLICGQFLYPVPLTSQMLLPLMLKENILALRGREVKNGKNNKNPIRTVSVYGIYENTEFNEKDFHVDWTTDGEDYQELCFASSLGEQTIDIVDGSFGQLQYADLCDPSFLLGLATQHNTWVQANSNTIRTTATLGSDNGVDALYSAGITRYWTTEATERDTKSEERKDAVIDGMTKSEAKLYKKYLARVSKGAIRQENTGPYADRAIVAYSFGYRPFLEPWQVMQQFFITPVLKIDNTSNSVEEATGVYQMAVALGEPLNLVPAQGDNTFPTLAVAHQSYAELMVKQPFADRAAYDASLLDLTQKGQAGILGALGSEVLSAFGHSGVDLAAGVVRNLPY